MAIIPFRREDHSEVIPYNFKNEDYYVFIGTEKMSDHPNNIMLTHWHNDIELIVPIRGHMKCNVNGEVFTLQQGTGVFFNSQQIHHCFSYDETDCEFIYFLWHPIILCATGGVERKYIEPILVDSSIPYIYLSTDIKWKNDIISATYEAINSLQTNAAPLMIQSILYKIWFIIYENIYEQKSEKPMIGSQLSTLKLMLDYIEKNYAAKIYLEDIASSGNVSISCCNSIFKRYLKEAPIKYLLNYRLQRSCELLVNSNQSITQVAYECGFSTTSYYIDAFRKKYNCTPLEYRKKEGP